MKLDSDHDQACLAYLHPLQSGFSYRQNIRMIFPKLLFQLDDRFMCPARSSTRLLPPLLMLLASYKRNLTSEYSIFVTTDPVRIFVG